MSSIKVVIVDDERPARKELIFLLKPYLEIVVIGEADNIKDAIELIKTTKPDAVFLDIQLSGENGFDLLKMIPVNFKVIFVTAYNEFAIKAFDVNASDYLLKPVDPARLDLSIKRLLQSPTFEKHANIKRFEYNDSIYVKHNNCSAGFVEISSIIAITSVGNHSKLEVIDGTSYIVLKTLKQWIEELPENLFIRIHRSTIINIKYIIKIDNYSKSHHMVHMKHMKAPFEVSRSCFKNLKK